MRTVKYRVDILRGGVPFGELEFTGAPTVYCGADDESPLTFRGEFRRNPAMDYITDELQPVMTLDGIEYPLGVYSVGTMFSRKNEAGVMYDSITAYDRTRRLRLAKTETREFWAAGTPYLQIVQTLLTRAGIRMAIAEGTDAVLATDREDWDIGTPFLKIINELLGEIAYNRVWFDLSGAARVQAYRPPSPDRLDHVYRDGDAVKVLGPEYGTEMDIFDAPNVFIGILENPEYPEPLTATAVNDAPASRISTISRGMRVPTVFVVENIADGDALQAYVNRVRDESMRTSEYVDIETVNLGTHGVGDVIGVQLQDLNGIFRERSWTLTMRVGSMMQHRLERVVIV